MYSLTLNENEKIDILKTINWDYLDNPQNMLSIIEGKSNESGAFNKDKLFIRSIETLTWHYVVALWGIENILELYTPKLSSQIWNKDRRKQYDFILAFLRNEPLPTSRWGTESYISKRHRFFSDRRNSS